MWNRKNPEGRMVGWTLMGAAVCFWTNWYLMPGVGVTAAAKILSLVAAQPQRVLASSILQYCRQRCWQYRLPGLSLRFSTPASASGTLGVTLLAVGACGDGADAIYHQLAFQMVRPGIDQAAMLPVMQRTQTADLLYLLPLIAAFLFGCVVFSIAAARRGLVSKWNPILYALCLAIAFATNGFRAALGVSGRDIGWCRSA